MALLPLLEDAGDRPAPGAGPARSRRPRRTGRGSPPAPRPPAARSTLMSAAGPSRRVTSPKRSRSSGTALVGELEPHQLGLAEPVGDPRERAVVDERAVRDDQHPRAERLDVAHVVARQEHRHPAPGVVVAQAFLDRHLRHHVEADRRLVEQEQLRLVQQRGDQLHLHPLAQRQLADRLAGQLPDAEQLGQLAERAPGSRPAGIE